MKVIVYVNWNEEEIITEKEYKKKLEERRTSKEDFEEYVEDYLSDYIEYHFRNKKESLSYAKVFHLTERERAEIVDGLRKSFKEQVEEELSNEWDEIEMDI